MDVFVARQPIFNKKKEVVAYELLYRKNYKNSFSPDTDGDHATSDVIVNGLVLIGLDNLVGEKKAFINFTERLLLEKMPMLLPKEQLVIEVLENIEPTDEIVDACRELKAKGYIIALDDFVFHPKYKPLIELADIIKVDFILTPENERKQMLKHITGKKIRLLAEKVETQKDYDQAIKLGFSYFQGYFFDKPVIMTGKDIQGLYGNYLQLIGKTYNEEAEFEELAGIIERDLSLSYKLLKYLNHSGQYLLSRITSIKHALMILGLDEVKKWIALILIRGISDDKPDIVTRVCMTRARFCENMAELAGIRQRNTELFILGMFSMIDVLTNRLLEDILKELPISEDIKLTLLGRDSAFSNIYGLVVAYEKADWNQVNRIAAEMKLDISKIPELYYEALNWADHIFMLENSV